MTLLLASPDAVIQPAAVDEASVAASVASIRRATPARQSRLEKRILPNLCLMKACAGRHQRAVANTEPNLNRLGSP